MVRDALRAPYHEGGSVAEGALDHRRQLRLALAEHDAVGIVGQIIAGDLELGLRLVSRDQAVEQDIIGRERVGLAVRQHLIGLLVIRRGHDVEAERKLLVDGVHRLLVSSAFRHHHRLAFQVRGRRDR